MKHNLLGGGRLIKTSANGNSLSTQKTREQIRDLPFWYADCGNDIRSPSVLKYA